MWPLKVFGILVCVIAAIAICGFAVLQLWNWLMPALFGLKLITFWQAVGLLVLCRLLFGGSRGFSKGRRGRWGGRGMRERWARMTPEERETFVRGMKGRWEGVAASPGMDPKG